MIQHPDAVVLDTCAVIWLANGDPMRQSALDAIVRAGLASSILVSTASAWEIGMLSRPRPNRQTALEFRPDPQSWFSRFLAGPGIKEAAMTPEIAIDASYLPGDLHSDPGDRLIIATARRLGVPIITRDSKIIAYSEAGFVSVIPC